MSIHEIVTAANQLMKVMNDADVTVIESFNNSKNFRVVINYAGKEFFESGTPQYLIGFLKGFAAGGQS